ALVLGPLPHGQLPGAERGAGAGDAARGEEVAVDLRGHGVEPIAHPFADDSRLLLAHRAETSQFHGHTPFFVGHENAVGGCPSPPSFGHIILCLWRGLAKRTRRDARNSHGMRIDAAHRARRVRMTGCVHCPELRRRSPCPLPLPRTNPHPPGSSPASAPWSPAAPPASGRRPPGPCRVAAPAWRCSTCTPRPLPRAPSRCAATCRTPPRCGRRSTAPRNSSAAWTW